MTKVRDKAIIKKFGRNLKKVRLSQGLSQEELAYASDIPINQIGRIERGEVNTTISTIAAIAKALKIPASELIG